MVRSWKAKAEHSAINLVDESDGVNPFISLCLSDERDVNEEMNVIEDETEEEIIM